VANTNLKLVGLDFDELKNNFKEYLKRSDSTFKDVDYEGSNISQLLDIFAYNTYINSFYLNMVASEMFLDSATLRDSVISHAKELNYVPRSYRSSEARVSFGITPSTALDALLVPKGTSFTTKIGSNSYSFSTDTSTVLIANSSGAFTANNLVIYEGSYLTDTFVYSSANSEQRFVISNPTVDTRSITVIVLENGGSNSYSYSRASSFLDQSANSQIYFLQAAENSQYELIFGDDIIGRKPQNGSTIVVEYRVCNGELPNGAYTFSIDGPIQGQSNIYSLTTNQSARGGGVSESLQSIKYNAPRYYQNQDRAITSTDYENILIANFPEIEAVSAHGGEEASPPDYGRVYISVDTASGDGVAEADKARYLTFIRGRTPLGLEPVIIDPEFLYVEVVVKATYNTNVTSMLPSTIDTLIRSTISNYNLTYLNGFNKTLRFSKLIEELNKVDPSILGIDMDVHPLRTFIPTPGTKYTTVIDLGYELTTKYVVSEDDAIYQSIPAVRSTLMVKNGRDVFLMDDLNGNLGLYTAGGTTQTLLEYVGTVDYLTGKVDVNELLIDSYTPASGNHVHLYGNPISRDISVSKNTILKIREADVEVAVTATKE
jgi:hypothetical protein